MSVPWNTEDDLHRGWAYLRGYNDGMKAFRDCEEQTLEPNEDTRDGYLFAMIVSTMKQLRINDELSFVEQYTSGFLFGFDLRVRPVRREEVHG